MEERVAVVGLGYVGLPVVLAFGSEFADVVGFDIDRRRVAELSAGIDRTREVEGQQLLSSRVRFTSDDADLVGRDLYIVAVPTPVDADHRPDLSALVSASRTVGAALRPGAIVVYESTVYPGATEDVCGPVLEEYSGLTAGVDFTLGYSPERINPGDTEHRFERITKVVAAQDPETLARLSAAYSRVVHAGVHAASSIKVAEAAKVLENTQRDLNVALMNELAIICERLGIRTADVLDAARTKWNFLPFTPGLVGGHCIGVDPYYLTTKAEQLGYRPEVILAGRRINDRMGEFIATTLVKRLARSEVPLRRAHVGIMGLTFKENVPDLRNSRVPDIVNTLQSFGIDAMVHDPLADASEASDMYGIRLHDPAELVDLDALVLAVPHDDYLRRGPAWLVDRMRPSGILVDVRSALSPDQLPTGLAYWSL